MNFFGMGTGTGAGTDMPSHGDEKIFTFDRKCMVIPSAKGHPGKRIVCGLGFASWCGHCDTLKPKWVQMHNNIRAKVKKHQYHEPVFAPFEDSNMDLLREFNQKNADYLDNETVNISAYPTIFKIHRGKISYYDGEREPEPMERWFMSESVVKAKKSKKTKKPRFRGGAKKGKGTRKGTGKA